MKRETRANPREGIWDPEQLVSQGDLAKLLGTTQPNISQLTQSGVFEREAGRVGRNGAGLYPLGHNIRRWAAYKIRHVVDDSERELRGSRKRKLDAEAASAEIELARKRSEVVDVRLVVIFLEDLVIRVRCEIMAIPARMARKIVKKDVKSTVGILKGELERALHELSRAGSEGRVLRFRCFATFCRCTEQGFQPS
jgi:phage terminase Nu1 subunit (DNA packaging protein)